MVMVFINLYRWGVSKTTSPTDWQCEKEEDDKARERTMFHTHCIKPRAGGPASSEGAQTNATETAGGVALCWFLSGSALQGWIAWLEFPTPPTALSPSGPPLWVSWDAHVLLAQRTGLQHQNSSSWLILPASLPGGWEHRYLGGGGRRGGGSWCQWHISHVWQQPQQLRRLLSQETGLQITERGFSCVLWVHKCACGWVICLEAALALDQTWASSPSFPTVPSFVLRSNLWLEKCPCHPICK